MKPPTKIIRAGGAVVTREDPRAGTEVMLVYRRRYDDWTLPKGKVENGEPLPVTAVREVEEETGLRTRLNAPLDTVSYLLPAGQKRVSWWNATVISERWRPPDSEIDEIRWLPVRAARQRLTYSHDHFLVEQALAEPTTLPLILVRHAKAMDRKDWSKSHRDSSRPLNSRGRRQARRLPPLFDAYGVAALVSSGSTRCVTTLQPYAQLKNLEIARYNQLSEEHGIDDPKGVARLVRSVRARALEAWRPTTICIHRPVLPAILDALDLVETTLVTGEMLIAHLTPDGEVHAIERHRPEG